MTINFQKVILTYIQNWQTSIASLLLFSLVFTFSCKNPQKISLERQLSENPSGVFFTDTFVVKTETVIIDTPSTKNQLHLVIGTFEDPVFGKIKNQSFVNLNLPVTTLPEFNKIDSVVVSLDYDFILGNISEPAIFSLYSTKDSITTSGIYNRLSSIDTVNKISENFVLRHNDLRSFKNHSEKLKELFTGLKGKILSEELKGITFVPEETSTFAFGMNTDANGFLINIYIDNSQLPVVLNIVNQQRFTNVEVANEKIESALSTENNFSYTNDVLGIGSKISIPGLDNFLPQIKEQFVVTEASFIIPSSPNYIQTTETIFPSLFMYECNPDGTRKKTESGYKIVQDELIKGQRYLPAPLNGTGNELFINYNNTYGWFNYPYTLHVREIENGKLENTPLIISGKSKASFDGAFSQSPFTYSFRKGGNSSEKKISFIVYYNKIGL